MILGTQDGRRVDSQKLSLDLQTYTMVHMCPIPPLHYKHTHNNDNFLLSQEIPDLGEGEHCMRWPLWSIFEGLSARASSRKGFWS